MFNRQIGKSWFLSSIAVKGCYGDIPSGKLAWTWKPMVSRGKRPTNGQIVGCPRLCSFMSYSLGTKGSLREQIPLRRSSEALKKNRTSTDAKRCFQVHEKCNMTEEDPTLVLIGGYRADVGPTQSFKAFRNYEHMKKYFKSSDWWRNAL